MENKREVFTIVERDGKVIHSVIGTIHETPDGQSVVTLDALPLDGVLYVRPAVRK
jgi:hypothetical protein